MFLAGFKSACDQEMLPATACSWPINYPKPLESSLGQAETSEEAFGQSPTSSPFAGLLNKALIPYQTKLVP